MTLKLITVKNVYVHHQNDGTLLCYIFWSNSWSGGALATIERPQLSENLARSSS